MREQRILYSYHEKEIVLSHTVVEFGEDYVVVKDSSDVKDVVVPVYTVKAAEKVQAKLE